MAHNGAVSSNESVHPSLLDISTYGSDSWRGAGLVADHYLICTDFAQCGYGTSRPWFHTGPRPDVLPQAC